jgi:NAD(P)-dependent dehydrogenase (short-subunit alcohol dehydrogenase family)
MNISSFPDKKYQVVVTGSGGGIGNAIASSFTNCFKIDRHNCDLSNEDEIKNIVKQLEIPVGVLINCAGVSLKGQYGDLDYWDKTFAVNVRAVYYLSSLVKDLMVDGGSIINITSIGAEQGFGNNPAYVASKGALKMLTKAMAMDWGRLGIRVNNVCPGYIVSKMTYNSWINPVKRKVREDRTTLKRWGIPSDIVGICKFLASEEASYITGTDIVVDGGWLSKGV